MDIICKCGHNAHIHSTRNETCLVNACYCRLNEEEVYQIYITEQQARLDTNRAQVEALIAERDALVEVNSKTWCAYCEKRYVRADNTMDQIREHISVCEKHPMRKVEAERDALKEIISFFLEKLYVMDRIELAVEVKTKLGGVLYHAD